jgi:hypothetical protein
MIYKTVTVPVALKPCTMRSIRVREEHTIQIECLKNELCVLRKDHLLRSNEKDRMHIQFVEEMSWSMRRRCDDTITMHSGKYTVRMECGHWWLRPVSIGRLYYQHCQAFKARYHSTGSHITTLWVHNSHTAPFECDSISLIGVWIPEVNGRHRAMPTITQHNMMTTWVKTFVPTAHTFLVNNTLLNEWVDTADWTNLTADQNLMTFLAPYTHCFMKCLIYSVQKETC